VRTIARHCIALLGLAIAGSTCLAEEHPDAGVSQIEEAANTTSSQQRFVIANWITPMPYRLGQSPKDIARDDIRAALEAGIDGFALNVFSGKQAAHALDHFIGAANSLGADNFKVVLSVDTAHSFPFQDLIQAIIRYGADPHYLKLDGKPVLTTYRNQDDSWWKRNVLDPLNALGHPVTFIPYFHLPSPNRDTPTKQAWLNKIDDSPSIDGLFPFIIPGSPPFYSGDPRLGRHKWSGLEAQENLAAALRERGKIMIGQYMPYYWGICRSAGQYVEFQGGRGMANNWTSIIERQRPQGVEIVTWNDHIESTFIQPTRIPSTKFPDIVTQPHLGYYELLKYYISWYKRGTLPQITKDGVFYFYRTHPLGAVARRAAAKCKPESVTDGQLWGAPQDVIYVTTALTSAAKLRVTSGTKTYTFDVAPGMTTTDVPFLAGPQTFEIVRNGVVLASGRGTLIVASPEVRNFNVFSGYAISDGSSSDTWLPSGKWKDGIYATWFK
jgi:hypothetical protein